MVACFLIDVFKELYGVSGTLEVSGMKYCAGVIIMFSPGGECCSDGVLSCVSS